MNYRNFEDAFDLWTPNYIQYNDENVTLKSYNPNKDVTIGLASILFNSGDLDIVIDLDNLNKIKTHETILTFTNNKCWMDLDFEDEESMNGFLDVYNNGL